MLSSLRGPIITKARLLVLLTMQRILPARIMRLCRRGTTKMCQRAIALRRLLVDTIRAQSKVVLGCPLATQQLSLDQVVLITTMTRTQTREIKDMHPLGPDNLPKSRISQIDLPGYFC